MCITGQSGTRSEISLTSCTRTRVRTSYQRCTSYRLRMNTPIIHVLSVHQDAHTQPSAQTGTDALEI
ncbi:hypothetical protein A0H81_00701 [Grifola frondosa]|uniref:Uncharacterized protein n=1 Tax=Grifola frondosa TaxID=5627 RepID=A0A1C7MSW4_GRIFR|nr:hypothetical protein A0H81_00701 [Grifola frondosa]